MKKVSIIMPTYKRAQIIKKSIKSVLNQTYTDFELIIVDDGSGDGTSEVVESLSDKRIKFYELEENKGACYARNYAIDKATGDYFAFLDSDNVWNKKYLEKRIAHLEKQPENVGGVFGNVKLHKKGERSYIFPVDFPQYEVQHEDGNDSLIKYMLFNNAIDTNSIVLKSDCLHCAEGFNNELRRLQDWEFFFRIVVESGYKIAYINDLLVNDYIQKDSITNGINNDAYWNSRVYILQHYKDVYEQKNCKYEAIADMIFMIDPYCKDEDIDKLIDGLSSDELSVLIKTIKKRQYKFKLYKPLSQRIREYYSRVIYKRLTILFDKYN
ncbi:MAG: glycosyltransferase [Lachnospiraceae bacterium]|nr:glycosyltransferase [Lachnospiraceae bacterium]